MSAVLRILVVAISALLGLAGCASPAAPLPGSAPPVPGSGASTPVTGPDASTPVTGPDGRPFVVADLGRFDEPWAMAFLPDGDLLITQRGGELLLRSADSGSVVGVAGTPSVVHAGQGGLGDVIVSPQFATDRTIYLSWVEAGEAGTTGAAVGRARLDAAAGVASLADLTVLWRQRPKVNGAGHFGHRLALSPDGRHLFVSSGERQKFDPAQDLTGNLGKIVRLDLGGRPATGNPFAAGDGVAAEVWTLGHRNPLGLAFDADGNLWESEMGPKGGDEVNLIVAGRNYGWPKVSNGSHYDGRGIPDHSDGDGFEPPKVWWNPSISPGSLMIYSGSLFPQWQGDAFVGALSGQALIRLELDGTDARAADQWDMGQRIREVEQAPDGAIWLLEDEPGGRLLRLSPPE